MSRLHPLNLNATQKVFVESNANWNERDFQDLSSSAVALSSVCFCFGLFLKFFFWNLLGEGKQKRTHHTCTDENAKNWTFYYLLVIIHLARPVSRMLSCRILLIWVVIRKQKVRNKKWSWWTWMKRREASSIASREQALWCLLSATKGLFSWR